LEKEKKKKKKNRFFYNNDNIINNSSLRCSCRFSLRRENVLFFLVSSWSRYTSSVYFRWRILEDIPTVVPGFCWSFLYFLELCTDVFERTLRGFWAEFFTKTSGSFSVILSLQYSGSVSGNHNKTFVQSPSHRWFRQYNNVFLRLRLMGIF
jgi:hypothetical protein